MTSLAMISPYARRLVPLFLFILLFGCTPESRAESEAGFIKALDGDSIVAEINGISFQVRLLGIDCPEKGEWLSDAARDFTTKFCRGRTLRLEFESKRRDRYERNLCYVFAGERMLNLELVRAGLARTFMLRDAPNRARELDRAQKEARRNKAGIWGR